MSKMEIGNKKKVERIESLKDGDLNKLVLNIIKKAGYQDVLLKPDFIQAKIESGLVKSLHIFILFEHSLSGEKKFKERIKGIKENLSGVQSPNSIFIITTGRVSNRIQNEIELILEEGRTEFWDVDDLVKKINDLNPDFWKGDDLELIEYEKHFLSENKSNSDLKKLKIFNEKHKELLDFFIEPKLTRFKKDKKTNIPLRKVVNWEDLLLEDGNIILAGDAGAGKTTLLKKIGQKIIEENKNEEKQIPIMLFSSDFIESEFNLAEIIKKKLFPFFQEMPNPEDIILLIDSIDEFKEETQDGIFNDIEKEGFRYVLATRNQEKFTQLEKIGPYHSYFLTSFNNEQIIKFVKRFFGKATGKAQRLIDSLKDQRVIEKIPITPLTLSLISILYEDSNFEIPATITDIYENFSIILLGKLSVPSRIKLIDVSYRERLLTIYALRVLKNENHEYCSKFELVKFFRDYYRDKKKPIEDDKLEDLIDFLIDNTGILKISHNNKVVFRHDSFLEYYAALEIFKHRRELEDEIVKNFFDFHWQNTAIFYAGMSKDLPKFLEKINDKIVSARKLPDLFSSILGAGYLLQSLYQTDDKLRSKTVDISLTKNIEAYELFLRLTSNNETLEGFNVPILMLLSSFYFFENFNSITLKSPLTISFNKLLSQDKKLRNKEDVFKALQIALTMGSSRIDKVWPMELLVEDELTTSHPVYTSFLYISLDMFENNNYERLKKKIDDTFKRQKEPINYLLKTPAKKLRLSSYDIISAQNKVQIIVEGKTDAEIIEHAYLVLNDGELPPWQIKVSGNFGNGGAQEVSKTLMNCEPTLFDNTMIIGIFDRDEKGVQEYNSLKANVFDEIEEGMIKKHKSNRIFGLLLPVPEFRKGYIGEKQKDNYFEIEHYFLNQFLESENALLHHHNSKEGEKIYEIRDKSKKKVVKKALASSDIEDFEAFNFLFKYINKMITDFEG